MESPTRWKQIRAILEQVLDSPVEEQDVLAVRLCGSDTSLLREVREYVDADDQTNEVAPMGIGETLDELEPLAEDDMVGAYRIIGELGRGGMGVVYKGRREDGVSLDVAIKVLKRGVDTRDVVSRFLRERQILADLQHPNIARFLDSGSTDDGRPYFVMEHVDGTPIDFYCDQHRLDVGKRLELFQKVCHAISFAHRNMVTHRDIKPSNILVTAEGVPKLLDFGIAGVLNPITKEQHTLTALEARMMTPTWAAPEQVRGDRLTASCDVYALGLLLYRLLCGRFPFRLNSRAPHMVMAAIMDQPADQPGKALMRQPNESAGDGASPNELAASRGESVANLRKRLRGDLNNISLMALAKHPEDRYDSADALRQDIRRYLTGHPVRARRPTVSYRTQLFLRRNKILVSAAALVVSLIIGFMISLAGKQRQITHEAATANQAVDFLINLFEDATPERRKGEEVSAEELLDRGAAKIETDLADQPEVQARLMSTMGKAYQKLGNFNSALILIEKSLAVRRDRLDQSGNELAQALLDVAVVHHHRENYEQAEMYYQQALDLDKNNGLDDLLVADVYADLGSLRYEQGRVDEAMAWTRKAFNIQNRVLPKGDPDLSKTRSNMASIFYLLGRFNEAEELWGEELVMNRERHGNLHPDTLRVMGNLANLYRKKQDFEKAENFLQEVVKSRRRVLGVQHLDTIRALSSLGHVLVDSFRFQQAAEVYQEVIDHLEPGRLQARRQRDLGSVLTHLGRLEEAEALHRRALAIFTKGNTAGKDWQEGAGWVELGLTLAARSDDRRADCEAHIMKGLGMLDNTLGASHSFVQLARGGLGECLYVNGHEERGLALMQQSVTALDGTSYHPKAKARLTNVVKRTYLKP